MIANAHIKIGSNSNEKVKTFKYLGSLLTNQNCIQEEIKYRLSRKCVIIQFKHFLLQEFSLRISTFKIYKTIILPVGLYGCETWSLTLREECRVRVFESRILRLIFGLKRDTNGDWRRLHNEELHSLYRSPNIVRVIEPRRFRWTGHVDKMEEGKSAFKIFTGKRPLARPRGRWENNIRMDLKEIGTNTRNLVCLAQDRN